MTAPEGLQALQLQGEAKVFLVYEGPDGQTVRRLEGEMTIGPSAESDITLADGRVSKSHASLSSRDGQWVLDDLDSAGSSLGNDAPARTVNER